MNYGNYVKYDTANGPGIRNSLFTSGCTHHCPGCFNRAAWDFNFGKLYTPEVENMIVEDLKDATRPVSGISILGGEPFDNPQEIFLLVRRIKDECPTKTIWIWSGYTYEEIMDDPVKRAVLMFCDTLVDGKFVEERKNPALKFRGSENQRIIDVPLSRIFGTAMERKLY